jgi:hypothetical protein
MSRTTPPRPLDITAIFPQLAPLARTTTRLHPRPGPVTPHDSSIGGPLRWPSAEPWPYCDGPHELAYGETRPLSLADVRLLRQLGAGFHSVYTTHRPTAQEREVVEQIRAGRDVPEGPIAMLPAAQLYARDVPQLRPPTGADLLQVLWCPFSHAQEFTLRTALFWRAGHEITDILVNPPEPAAVQIEEFVPEPCRIHPEEVTEYPRQNYNPRHPGDGIDYELSKALDEWSLDQPDEDLEYSSQLSVAPGWKVGGWTPWSRTDPIDLHCTACGASMDPLLTIASNEWDSAGHSWIPYQDQDHRPDAYPPPFAPTMINLGDADNQQLFICSANPNHPHTSFCAT